MNNPSNNRQYICRLLLLTGLLACGYAFGTDDAKGKPTYQRSEAPYQVPEVMLVRQDGKKVSFKEELDDGRPVIMNFIYSSCTTICPVLSHVFSKAQAKLGKERDQVHMVSISLDPEHDTPAKLIAYSKKFKAGPQ